MKLFSLKTLVVLTFIWSGMNVFINLNIFLDPSQIATAIASGSEQVIEIYQNAGIEETELNKIEAEMSNMSAIEPQAYKMSALYTIISCLLIIFGGIKVWDLKLIGFYFLLAGYIVGILAPVPYFGTKMLTFCCITTAIALGSYYPYYKQLREI